MKTLSEAANEDISPKYLFPLSPGDGNFFQNWGTKMQIPRKERLFPQNYLFPCSRPPPPSSGWNHCWDNIWNFLAWGKKLWEIRKIRREHIKISRKDLEQSPPFGRGTDIFHLESIMGNRSNFSRQTIVAEQVLKNVLGGMLSNFYLFLCRVAAVY